MNQPPTPTTGYTVRTLDRALAEARAADFLTVLRQFPEMKWTRDNLLVELPGKWEVSLVVCDEADTVCGYAVNSLRGDSLYIHLLVVAESQRGQGLGTQLLARALELAGERPGVRCLRLRATIDWTDTLKFYERVGFVVRDELPETRECVLELPVKGGGA